MQLKDLKRDLRNNQMRKIKIELDCKQSVKLFMQDDKDP